ncbi:MAG TPA: hypothetical protein DCX53_06720 [Anaerolineae bacterium]|nr:hypothetical protein [Anaerolineae bacterium]
MNQFFYESRGREKVNDLINEGLKSQTYHRSAASKPSFLRRFPTYILIGLGILGVLQMIVR